MQTYASLPRIIHREFAFDDPTTIPHPAAWKSFPSDLHDITDTSTVRQWIKSVCTYWSCLSLTTVCCYWMLCTAAPYKFCVELEWPRGLCMPGVCHELTWAIFLLEHGETYWKSGCICELLRTICVPSGNDLFATVTEAIQFMHMTSVVESGHSHKFAFNKKAFRPLHKFQICWKCSTLEWHQMRMWTSSQPKSYGSEKKKRQMDRLGH